VLVDACGLAAFERAVFVDEMLERQGRNARFWVEVQAGSKAVDATAQQTSDRIAWSLPDHEHAAEHRNVFGTPSGDVLQERTLLRLLRR
jgi:hypothetical protein